MRTYAGRALLAPTDLITFLGCQHATALDLLALEGRVEPPAEVDPTAVFLRQKGIDREKAFVNRLEAEGRQGAHIPEKVPLLRRVELTAAAMAAGADYVYQGAFLAMRWHGFADFLMRTDDLPSVFGAWSYEALDTKLASHVAPRHIIQVTQYSGLLAALQGIRPRRMAIALGNGSIEEFRPDDYRRYVKLAAIRLRRFLSSGGIRQTVPEPCAHCEICRWRPRCDAEWQAKDHLSAVAFIRRSQRDKLAATGITTTAGLAAMRNTRQVSGMHPETLQRLRDQARLQVAARGTDHHLYRLLPVVSGRGLSRLPAPDSADLFLDLEGDPLLPGGLEYLFGLRVGSGEHGRYHSWWAHDRKEERAAAEQLLDFVADHLKRHPGAFIYHYGNYEVAALRRLVMRHGTRELVVDDLLRKQKFVDLYAVVREGIQISEPHYSLKDLEKFYGPPRQGDVATAMASVIAYETWRSVGDDALLRQIEAYNEVDCRSASAARDWLLLIRPPETEWFSPTAAFGEIDERRAASEQELVTIRAALMRCPPSEVPFRTLVADLLDFHRREQKVDWWSLFDRQNRTEPDLVDDPECLGALRLLGQPRADGSALVHTFAFPAQETKLCVGDRPMLVSNLEPAGAIEALNMDRCVARVRRSAVKGPLPVELSLGPGKPVGDRVLRDALKRFAAHVACGTGRFVAVERLLRREPPRLRGRNRGGTILLPGQDAIAGAAEAVAALDHSWLYIQGPPGTGKTHTAARVVVHLLRNGKRVALTSHSHKAINNLCAAVERAAIEARLEFKGYKKSTAGDVDTFFGGTMIRDVTSADRIPPDAALVAGTAWLFARQRFEQAFDHLVVDEAGQVSLANLIVMGTAARNLLLVGDQMQLSQPIQGCHPGESGCSGLEYLLAGKPTVPPDRGILLDVTWRMHPTLCAWVSAAVYEGRLRSHSSLSVQALLLNERAHCALAACGLNFESVEHTGRSQRSPEEIDVVSAIWHNLMGQRWRDRHGTERPIGPDNVLVMAPYNMQVNAIRDVLPLARVGTVDKFQGQEAPVAILSMTTSSGEDLPRGVPFLFSRQRLNVAISRGQCLSMILASPRLLEVPCRTVEEMRMVDLLCHACDWAWTH